MLLARDDPTSTDERTAPQSPLSQSSTRRSHLATEPRVLENEEQRPPRRPQSSYHLIVRQVSGWHSLQADQRHSHLQAPPTIDRSIRTEPARPKLDRGAGVCRPDPLVPRHGGHRGFGDGVGGTCSRGSRAARVSGANLAMANGGWELRWKLMPSFPSSGNVTSTRRGGGVGTSSSELDDDRDILESSSQSDESSDSSDGSTLWRSEKSEAAMPVRSIAGRLRSEASARLLAACTSRCIASRCSIRSVSVKGHATISFAQREQRSLSQRPPLHIDVQPDLRQGTVRRAHAAHSYTLRRILWCSTRRCLVSAWHHEHLALSTWPLDCRAAAGDQNV
jgi:hypothetical protein